MHRFLLALSFVLLSGAGALAADHYQTNLGPMPLDDETKTVIAGRGDATATLDGRTLTVQGSFHGLPSNATEAHIFTSPVAGVPGKQILDLTVTQATSGTLSGSYTLTAQQAKALRTGKVLQMPQVKPGAGKLTLADTLGFTMARLGMTDIIKEHVAGQAKNDGADPDAAVRLVPDYVGTYDEAVAYVNANSTYYNEACCVPDGADTPDGPF